VQQFLRRKLLFKRVARDCQDESSTVRDAHIDAFVFFAPLLVLSRPKARKQLIGRWRQQSGEA
jgi:hypothetical protein